MHDSRDDAFRVELQGSKKTVEQLGASSHDVDANGWMLAEEGEMGSKAGHVLHHQVIVVAAEILADDKHFLMESVGVEGGRFVDYSVVVVNFHWNDFVIGREYLE